MDLPTPFGAHPEWFGPLTVLAFGAAYVTAVVVGYRRGWPPAAWLVVLAAAGLGGVVGTRLLPLGLDGLRALWETGVLPEAGVRRIPGTVVGALLLAEGARRALGVRRSMLDPLAAAGLVGLAVARVGCLLAGCCFGTPTDLPWGMTYAAGSFAHGFHVVHGVVEAGANGPAPVHPIPFYDIAFALVVLALLPRIGRRLRAEGSLCGVVVGLYAAFRFVEDFVRANEVDVWAGLTAVQVGMAVLAALAFGAVAVAERRARGGRVVPEWAEPSAVRLVAVLAVVLAARVGLSGWLTASEAAVLLIRLVPAVAAVAVVVVRRSSVPQLRWTAAAVAGAVPLVVGFQTSASSDSSRAPFDLWAVEAHGDLGRYEEFDICSTRLYEYASAGGGVARIWVDPDRELTREVGVRVYAGRQDVVVEDGRTSSEDEGGAFGAVHPYVQVEAKDVGFSFGAQVGVLPILGDDGPSPVLPAVGLRLGPRKNYLQVGYLDAPHFGAPAPVFHLGFGTGRLTDDGQELRVTGGLAGTGFYLAGAIPVDGRAYVEPMVAAVPIEGDRGLSYQAGVRVRVHLPAK
ncbi:prolipoprotein diacylglyceryl transferase [Rubrivirga sp.]|uniref:prolipoprotein diacylglyceryl transferase n=1 Tax=Rubrivirga sp. TaxID=1885344 RepID=UPI003B51B8A7